MATLSLMEKWQAFRANVRARLVADCSEWHRFATTWFTAIAAGLNIAAQEWPSFPDDWKQYIPHAAVRIIARASFLAIIVARVIKQPGLRKDP